MMQSTGNNKPSFQNRKLDGSRLTLLPSISFLNLFEITFDIKLISLLARCLWNVQINRYHLLFLTLFFINSVDRPPLHALTCAY